MTGATWLSAVFTLDCLAGDHQLPRLAGRREWRHVNLSILKFARPLNVWRNYVFRILRSSLVHFFRAARVSAS